MSRAFVSEDAAAASAAAVPERPVSRLPNLVTPHGLRLIEQRIAELQAALAFTQADAPERPGIARDLRYWRARRASAQLVEPAAAPPTEVAFGTAVTIRREGAAIRYRIVGEDEADPALGLLSWASPLAAALMGASVGDAVELGAGRPAVTVEAVEPG